MRPMPTDAPIPAGAPRFRRPPLAVATYS